MSTGDLPLFSMLKTRMRWHQERQKTLAENVSNVDTPGFKARDLKLPTFTQLVDGGKAAGPMRTDPKHMAMSNGAGAGFGVNGRSGFVTTPSGNAVNLEDEMMKVSQNALDYQSVTSLYQRSLGLIRTAIGKKTG